MNDGINNSGTDTDYGTGIAEDTGSECTVSDVPGNNDDNTNNTDIISDAMGSDILPVTDTESNTESATLSEMDNTEAGMEVPESTTESSSDSSVDYTYELNNIEYWQTQQLAEMQAVQSVSGNSIMVTLDEDSMQAITEVQEKQEAIIDGQATLCGLVGCLVFAVCADFLVHSAKRIMKNITGKKE